MYDVLFSFVTLSFGFVVLSFVVYCIWVWICVWFAFLLLTLCFGVCLGFLGVSLGFRLLISILLAFWFVVCVFVLGTCVLRFLWDWYNTGFGWVLTTLWGLLHWYCVLVCERLVLICVFRVLLGFCGVC